jgi:hypothetical protein
MACVRRATTHQRQPRTRAQDPKACTQHTYPPHLFHGNGLLGPVLLHEDEALRAGEACVLRISDLHQPRVHLRGSVRMTTEQVEEEEAELRLQLRLALLVQIGLHLLGELEQLVLGLEAAPRNHRLGGHGWRSQCRLCRRRGRLCRRRGRLFLYSPRSLHLCSRLIAPRVAEPAALLGAVLVDLVGDALLVRLQESRGVKNYAAEPLPHLSKTRRRGRHVLFVQQRDVTEHLRGEDCQWSHSTRPPAHGTEHRGAPRLCIPWASVLVFGGWACASALLKHEIMSFCIVMSLVRRHFAVN